MKTYGILLLLALAACGSKFEEKEAYANNTNEKNYVHEEQAAKAIELNASGSPVTPNGISTELPDVVVPKLIRTADLRFQVETLDKASDKIEEFVKKHGAYISTSNLSSNNSESNNTITIRVPNTGFDGLLKEVCSLSIYMQRKNVSTQDVTEEFIDIETRLKTKKEVEARYIDILKNKAKTVEDVLKAEEQIRLIREEIEAREGRLNYLKNQVGYSTITVELYQQIEYHENPQEVTESFSNKASSGFGAGWTAIQNIVIGLISVWPLLLAGGVAFYFIRKRIKRSISKK